MTALTSLVRRLFEGPLDLIGDIHGELPTLQALLAKLGYDEQGEHPDGRRLVFLGDLVDRGLDSPGVVDLVRRLVERGRAQCVLGNHELNLMRGKSKEGSRWFIGKDVESDGDDLRMRQRPVETDAERQALLDFFATLPIALEREDLRVVHACWDERAVALVREASSVIALFDQEEERISREIVAQGLEGRIAAENAGLVREDLDRLKKTSEQFPFCEAIGEKEVLEQGNAIRQLTSGPQSLVGGKPFFVGGKWRMSKRDRWWDGYEGETVVVVGHYWRSQHTAGGLATNPDEPDPLAGIEPTAKLGPKGGVRVIDYSVGLGYKRRSQVEIEPSLAALRWPEDALVFQALVAPTGDSVRGG
ncbi:MAG: metallophosphoesterase [Planctomycetes bacterium]|nr:metallophosphoesterase [Planctomycetota bacterium]